MHVVTGGAGFIGSHLVRALNDRGIDDIIVVDGFAASPAKACNLEGCRVAAFVDKASFRRTLESRGLPAGTRQVFHLGACTDTLEDDWAYLQANNVDYSKLLLARALEGRVPFVYASSAAVYGGGHDFREDSHERPANPYAHSKLAFDRHVRELLPTVRTSLVGLRYFNVYGPGEEHKGRMASMVHQVRAQLAETGVTRLFGASEGFAAGEHRRDFVFVDDVVKVNLFFADRGARGIFNVGSGRTATFNELARRAIGVHGTGRIEYLPFPESLRGRYQTSTRADLTALRGAGYADPFVSLEEGLARLGAYDPRQAVA
jgi:ADP-L-glycero-D-manno-heptose 6-epimerase